MALKHLALAAAVGAACAAPSATTPPNIILIMSDDMGIGEVGVYRVAPPPEGRVIATPNIDRLFQHGRRMLNAYTGEAVCAPSRASLLTGRHTGHLFSRGNYVTAGHDLPVPANTTTLPDLLAGQGYATALVGKWGLGWWNTTGAPWHNGYHYYFGQLDQSYCHNMYPGGPNPTGPSPDGPFPAVMGTWEVAQEAGPWGAAMPLTHHTYPGNANASRAFCMSPEGQTTCVYTHDLYTGKALELLQGQAQAQAQAGAAGSGTAATAPLFLFLSYTDPHPGGWQGVDEAGAPVPSQGAYASQPWPDVERDHASAISNYQDRDVGRILDYVLSTPSLATNTLILFTSDNGAHNEGGHDYAFFNSNGPYRGFKRSLYEGGVHTPFAAVWPGTIPANTTSDTVTAFWDLLPTLAEVAGVPSSTLPSDLDGVSVLQAWTGGSMPAPTDKPALYYEFCTYLHNDTMLPCGGASSGTGPCLTAFQTAVRLRDTSLGWKALSLTHAGPWQLFNLTADPYESTDVAAQYPDVVAQLAAIAQAQHTDNPLFPVHPCTPS